MAGQAARRHGSGRRLARSGAGSSVLSLGLNQGRSAPWAFALFVVDLFDDFVGDLAALIADVVSARVDVDDHVVRHAHRALALPAVGALLGVGQRDPRWTAVDLGERPRV